MPFTLLAHQAPVLPLKRWWPRLLSTAGLVVGSMAPDLEYFLRGTPVPIVGHSIVGQFTFCLPLTLAVVLLFERFMAAPLGEHLPDLGPIALRDVGLLAANRPTPRHLAIVAASALIGSLSHIFLDGFTHKHGFAVAWWPALRRTAVVAGHAYPIYGLLQRGLSVIFAAVSVWFLVALAHQRRLADGDRPRAPRPDAMTRFGFFGFALAVAAAGTFYRMALGPNAAAWHDAWFWGHVALQSTCFGFCGLLATCLRRAALSPRRAPA